MRSDTTTEPKSPTTIADVLTIQLAFILISTTVVLLPLSVFATESGLIGFVLLVAVALLALWFVVRVVFLALDDLLESKLAARERP